MKLNLNSKSFQTDFINPILEVTKDGRCAIFCQDDIIYSVSHVSGGAVYLYNTYKPIELEDTIPRFNINLEKLKKGMMCIKQEFVEFDITKSLLAYKDSNIKLNLRLLEDTHVALTKFNINTFKNFPFTFETTIAEDVIPNLRKAMDFTVDAAKFYLQKIDDSIYMFFGDKQSSHTDDVQVLVTDKFTGVIQENIYDTAILDLCLKHKSEISLKTSENGALLMQIDRGNDIVLNYLSPQLKK